MWSCPSPNISCPGCPSLFVLVFAFFMCYNSKMDMAVGSTPGCSMCVMHCLLSTLILLFVQTLDTGECREHLDAERREKWTTNCFVRKIEMLYLFPFLRNILTNSLCCRTVQFDFVLNRKIKQWRKSSSFIFVQYVNNASTQLVSYGQISASKQHISLNISLQLELVITQRGLRSSHLIFSLTALF